MKEEVIELKAIWYGGGFHFRLLNDKTGLVLDLDDYNESKKPSQIEDSKIINFWKKESPEKNEKKPEIGRAHV